MPSVLLRRDDVIVGVDTHKDEHVAVLLDGLGGKLAELFIPATLPGFAELLAFSLGPRRARVHLEFLGDSAVP